MKRPFQVTMRRSEIIGGIFWLVIYGFFMGDILGLGLELLGISYTAAQLNALFFLCNFVITALVFWRFLTKNLMLVPGNLLRTLKAMLLGFCIYWLLQAGIGIIGDLLSGRVDIPNDNTIAAIADENYRIMWAGAVLLAPMVEETLVRGLIFGTVRRLNRAAAYAAAALVFAAMHVLSYLGQMDALTLGYNILAYGMPSIALCACYEYAGNIWAPIGLHMIINALGMSAM
jgi:membrane protease YdiL (CAAX protease family)